MGDKIRIGLLGVGHLGKIHLKCLKNTPFEIVGVYDPNIAIQKTIKDMEGIKLYNSADALISDSDALDIVSTTSSHFDLALAAINLGKHVFVEKPITCTLDHANLLLEASIKHNVKVQVGHVERYNPALACLENKTINPKFIEGHRLSTFHTRGNDVSVIHDIMIHDIDLVLHFVKSDVIDIQANGVCVVNDTPDICNVRISFENGCVANLTASRISMKQMRKLRIFQENEYISLDFLKKESQIIKIVPIQDGQEFDGMTIETNSGKKSITIEIPQTKEVNAIEAELNDFHDSIQNDTHTRVDIKAGIKAIKIVTQIVDKINSSY